MIAQNLDTIRRRMAAACRRAGRKPEEITLIAVTKTFGNELIREAVRAGCRDFGENFVQELVRKRRELGGEEIRWHFIGHLQSNKVRHIIEWIHLIHSVDSVNLGNEISKRAQNAGRTVEVLVEVNSTAEKTKYGVRPEEAAGLIGRLRQLSNIKVSGLMTIGPLAPDPEESREAFRSMRKLIETLRIGGITLPHLSMGMTNDFEVAIEEGATMIRLGTAIFGQRSRLSREAGLSAGQGATVPRANGIS